MYRTCLHCQRAFAANEAIEHLPIGRRIAFDGHRGRLWVVCGKCGRWNLVPFESRWEALEECEKAYRTATRRASTDQIALARLAEGLDLVRIGEPLRPEFAAWRYGEVLRVRTRRAALLAAGLAVGVLPLGAAGVWVGGAVGGWIGGLMGSTGHLIYTAVLARSQGVTIRPGDGRPVRLGLRSVAGTEIHPAPDGFPEVHVPLPRDQRLELSGAVARRWLPNILAAATPFTHRGVIGDAITQIEDMGGSDAMIDWVARPQRWSLFQAGPGRPLADMAPADKLALEMALHEESERRALEGELHLLLDAWREAEELAAIADRLALPTEVENRLETLKGAARSEKGVVGSEQ